MPFFNPPSPQDRPGNAERKTVYDKRTWLNSLPVRLRSFFDPAPSRSDALAQLAHTPSDNAFADASLRRQGRPEKISIPVYGSCSVGFAVVPEGNELHRLPAGTRPKFLVIEQVTKHFGSIEAVRGISLTVDQGTIFGLVGSDGAGKSTLLRMVATMIAPSSGDIYVGGFHTLRERAPVKALLGYLPQRFSLYPDLTVEENLNFFLDIYRIGGEERKRRKERYLGFSHLAPFADRKAGTLSGGMKQKLGLACALVHEPRGLILDEPTNGVDPISRQEFWEILGEMRREGMTIIVSTAYLDEGERCDHLALMHEGRLLAQGKPSEIRADHPSLEEAMIEKIQSL